jgi:hypothetical protein
MRKDLKGELRRKRLTGMRFFVGALKLGIGSICSINAKVAAKVHIGMRIATVRAAALGLGQCDNSVQVGRRVFYNKT